MPSVDTLAEAAELMILRAKAEVCDAYRAWLASVAHKDRAAVSEALTRLQRLETMFGVSEMQRRAQGRGRARARRRGGRHA